MNRMKDYINGTFLKLTKEGRVADALNFCESLADRAPCVEFQCLALKNLAECHFFMSGDGEACREANLRGIRLMEEHPEILEGTEHMSRDLARRMYSDFCEQFRSVAVSFEEYEEYCEKPLRVRERNATEVRGLKAVEELKSQNAGWKENMFLLLNQYFPQSQWGGRAPAAAQGACLAQLILLNRRKLRTQPLDVNFAIQQYLNCTLAASENLIEAARSAGCRPVGGQIRFMYRRAEAIIETFRADRQADQPTVEGCLKNLASAKEHMMQSMTVDDDAPQPAGYLRMSDLDNGFAIAMELLKDVKLTAADVGKKPLGNRAQGGAKVPGKVGKFFRWLLFAAIIFAVAWGIWKLNLMSLTR